MSEENENTNKGQNEEISNIIRINTEQAIVVLTKYSKALREFEKAQNSLNKSLQRLSIKKVNIQITSSSSNK